MFPPLLTLKKNRKRKKERINIKNKATRALLHKINKNQFLFVNKLAKCCTVTNPGIHLRIVFIRHTVAAFLKTIKIIFSELSLLR